MNKKFQKLERNLLLTFVFVFVVSTVIATIFWAYRSNQTMKKYISALVTANGRQMELNIDNYLQKMEKNASLLFADEDILDYKKSDTEMSEYDRIQIENSVQEEIINMSLTENFTDFAIVYSDDTNIGWISKNTMAMYPDGGIYASCAENLENSGTSSYWSFEYLGNFSRIYFAKRLNDRAIILVSFYSEELSQTFEVPEELSEMTIRLVDENGQIVYSTSKSEIGENLPEEIGILFTKTKSRIQTVMNAELLATENICSNNWRVVCSIPAESLLRENQILLRKTLIVVIGLGFIFGMIAIAFYSYYSLRMNHMVGEISDMANSDLMTGLLNKSIFTQRVEEDLQVQGDQTTLCFLMFDLDEFKQINDQLGHGLGDRVIVCLAETLRATFGSEFLIGRLGGDEFGVYASFQDRDLKETEAWIQTCVEEFSQQFAKSVKRLAIDRKITASCGALTVIAGDYSYEQLYHMADRLLYTSKQREKAKEIEKKDDRAEGGEL